MSIHLYAPPYPLSQYIVGIWYVQTRVPYRRERILPTATVELMINFGSPHRKYAQDEQSFDLMQTSWVAGMHTTYIVNEPMAETNMLGVRFKPGGAHPFFDLPLAELTNKVVDMDCIWGLAMREIRERLADVPTINGRIHAMERILLRRLQERRTLPMVQHVSQALLVNGNGRSVRDLSDEVGVSQKHLIHQFKKTVGVSPKQLARIGRFQAVLNAIEPQQLINWGQVAHQCHYYDQAHFTRDFKAFTGMTPSAYLAQRTAVFGDDLAAGEAAHFVPVG